LFQQQVIGRFTVELLEFEFVVVIEEREARIPTVRRGLV